MGGGGPGTADSSPQAEMTGPRVDGALQDDGGSRVILSGSWTLVAIARGARALERDLARHAGDRAAGWDCLAIDTLDSTGAMLIWRAWGRRLPDLLLARPEQLRVFERIEAADRQKAAVVPPVSPFAWLMVVGAAVIGFWRHLVDFVALLGHLVLGIAHLARHPNDLPLREISANLFKSGVRAMPVTALVGFLIGIVLSYLSALQLRQFGAEAFIVNVLGMGLVRELGPVLVAILVAGRSGSAMTAQLGVMRVTEEIDALAVMGVPRHLRLVFPKAIALALVLPLLMLWATAIALVGGMLAVQLQLDIGYGFFLDQLPKVVPVANLWIGMGKSLVFGLLIALIACHFGLRVRPNTESLSANTTAAVVTAITVVILADGIFAILTRHVGIPR